MRLSLRLGVGMAVLLFACSVNAGASPVVLTFTGVSGNLAHFYDGGPGPNYGIEFLSGRTGTACYQPRFDTNVCLPDPPSLVPFGETNCPYPMPVNCTTMNVAGGFTTGLHFQYMSPLSSMAIGIYSDVDGGGTLLALETLMLTADLNSNLGAGFRDADIAFAGIARSAQFVQNDSGVPGAFDDIVIDRLDAVPEPATLASCAVGLLALALRQRRRSRNAQPMVNALNSRPTLDVPRRDGWRWAKHGSPS